MGKFYVDENNQARIICHKCGMNKKLDKRDIFNEGIDLLYKKICWGYYCAWMHRKMCKVRTHFLTSGISMFIP